MSFTYEHTLLRKNNSELKDLYPYESSRVAGEW